ncbi:MAG: ATP-binding protein [Bdellovibrionota bacterium]
MNRTVNILVVDDRPEGVMAIQAVLTDPSYNVVPASSGNEALRALLHHDFAVILMDVQMPIMNGFDTAQVIKTREKSRDIPIIFMSAINQDEAYVYQGYGVGAIDYILKPFDPFILKSKVAIFVEMYRKNLLIREQAQKLYEAEVKTYAQALDKLEIKSLRRYQYLADAIPQIVFRLLPDGHYEYFNKVWFEYTGQNLTVSSGKGWTEAIHLDDQQGLMDIFKPHVTHGVVDVECRIRRADGEYRWHLIRVEPERYEHPTEVKTWLGTATDIEERKRDEERQKFLSRAGELLVSSLDFEKTLENILDLAIPAVADWCTIDIENDGHILETISYRHRDPALEPKFLLLHNKILNHSEALGGNRVFRTGVPIYYSSVNDIISKRLVGDEEGISLAHELGDRSALIVPMRARDKTIGSITFTSYDLNRYGERDIEFAQELARRIALAYENSCLYSISQKAIEIRNDFLSIASHELNTPITSLKLQLQMTKKTLDMTNDGTALPMDRFKRSVDASCKQVDRLISLVQVLLDVSRIQSGKLTFKFDNISLKSMVTEIMERFKEIIDTSQCEVEVTGLSDLNVFWDRTRIEQVFINLLTNAIKYAPGKIQIHFQEIDGQVEFSFQDHGQGIPEEKLKTIFDRFERVGNNDSVSGLGLGLFIVKQIVEGHNGLIDVTSGEKTGSRFTVRLPVRFQPESKPEVVNHVH